MSLFKGDPNIFAIEFEVNESYPHLIGYAHLWIKGISLGDFKNEIMLLSLCSCLNDVLYSIQFMNNPDFLKLDDQILFDLICGPSDLKEEDPNEQYFDNGPYLILSYENFDDFCVFAFTVEDEMHFIWKLRDDFCSENLKDYPRDIFHKKVKISVVVSVINELSEFLNAFWHETKANKKE